MNYHIHFSYEGKLGSSEGFVYAKNKLEAYEKIRAHLEDKTRPECKGWKLYELVEEGTK